MNIKIHILKGSGRLTQVAEKIQKIADDAVAKTLKVIPLRDIDIIVYDDPFQTIEEIGVGGYTPNEHLVFMYLNPACKEFEKTIEINLGRVLTHELSHTSRWENPGYGETLFEALITEGLADHFEMEVNHTNAQPWNVAFTDDELRKVKKIAQEEYESSHYNHFEWFFNGSSERSIPKWAGYSLGFQIVGDYLKKHPHKKPSQLLNEKAEEFT